MASLQINTPLHLCVYPAAKTKRRAMRRGVKHLKLRRLSYASGCPRTKPLTSAEECGRTGFVWGEVNCMAQRNNINTALRTIQWVKGLSPVHMPAKNTANSPGSISPVAFLRVFLG